MDQLNKSVHFMPVNIDFPLVKLSELYIKEVVKLHGIPSSIVSDKDPQFTARFLISLQRTLVMRLDIRITHHPQIDGQLERTIQTLEDS